MRTERRPGRTGATRRARAPRRGGASLTLLALLALPAAACGQSDTPFEPVAPDGDVRVLFVGNSLTYTNDLPGMLATLLRDAGLPNVTIDELAEPNYGLEDHWNRPITLQRIAEGWDVVAMQQGPSATEGRPSLLEYSERFDEPIRDAGATPALYMVWPADARSFDFEGVSESYAMAADRVGGLLFPAGEAWLAAWETDETTPLYGPDLFHPSPLGTYAAALVMLEQIAGVDARDVDGEIPGYPGFATGAQLATVRAAAHRANLEHRRVPD